ncbi:hypothetical protein JCM10207_008181 [Rhodosporidiobolus poonsookiae]
MDHLALAWEGVHRPACIKTLRVVFLRTEGTEIASLQPPSGRFPLHPTSRIETPLLSTPGAVSAVLEVEIASEPAPNEPLQIPAQLAAYSLGPSYFNVRLFFPRSEREIWSSDTILRRSPYLATLLDAGFAESSGTSDSAAPPAAPETDYEDSDGETDDALPPSPPLKSLPAELFLHKTITILETAYSTYLAAVVWLQCGDIAFAPLSSTFLPASSHRLKSDAPNARLAVVLPPSAAPPTPLTLPAVSPKSVFRLAHLLELPELSSLALANFRSQLTVQNAAHELFSPVSCLYDEVRQTVLDFVTGNVREVFASQGMRDAERRAESGEVEGQEARVWARLAVRVARGK